MVTSAGQPRAGFEPRAQRTGKNMPASENPVETTYAEKTFDDRNRVKRYLQSRRLQDALRLASALDEPRLMVDFGAGNGEFCKWLAGQFPSTRIVCYEPHPGLLLQARDNLSACPGIEFAAGLDELPAGVADIVFGLEVFEHLPLEEMAQALRGIDRLLSQQGHAIIGVPIEIGPPALLKGLFRMLRRYGEYDASWPNVLRSTLARPPVDRPTVELMPGSRYHLHHTGFDYRAFRSQLRRSFREIRHLHSPLRWAGPWANAELTLLVAPRSPGAGAPPA